MLELISEHACYGGMQRFYSHPSREIGLPMRFSVFLPPQAWAEKVPALFCLAGLTCTEETFMTKAGAQRIAAEQGLMLITPDTSPRGANLPGAADSWDFGVGAGFYIDATEAPWNQHYRMYSYVFAPICAPTQSPWGVKIFSSYFGGKQEDWQQYDASALMAQRSAPFPGGILIDQGLDDKFLSNQLFPQAFEAACQQAQQPLELRALKREWLGTADICSICVIDYRIRCQPR